MFNGPPGPSSPLVKPQYVIVESAALGRDVFFLAATQAPLGDTQAGGLGTTHPEAARTFEWVECTLSQGV